jgi:crossover junction endodeoxyribonuclease RuvC
MIYLAFDPGVTGAFAVLDSSGEACYDIPVMDAKGYVGREIDGAELADMLRSIVAYHPAEAILERTSAMPGQGVASMFSMGVSRGVILGVLGALRISVREVEPRAWKKQLGLTGKDKDASLEMARLLFPSQRWRLTRKKDHNRAEALLLLYFLTTNYRSEK